ncbi:transient receptor potential ion channel family protein [Lachancea thermotolerans CBS 6340]|uniref:KLTH0H03564p n=1 Tax=Lachancea thermotolerans (strain ATCC 56472 / CBS 6340 / NRRL Y-8284) TaxID=559295 RepID=C5E2B3_LACTC|nr:KLTH0H03564p [Lachancea thermotolerans CBS 6340]CAR30174.1 KLTH0H03564p [Lachancea thermotolerans CBS 6340]
MRIFSAILLALNIAHLVVAKRKLVASSLVACMQNSQLTASGFSVVFDPDDRSLHYSLDMVTEINDYIYAEVDVYAYGFKIISRNIDLCSLSWKQFCPLRPGNVQVESIEYISESLAKQIPGIAYQVPDIDAFVRMNIYKSTDKSQTLACIQAFFSNGKTVSQTGVKWATAVIAGIGLLCSAVLSTFGNSNAASHISANTMSLFLYFQSVAVVSMEHVHRMPPIAAAWSENIIWSMGLIRISFMQRIFRWFVQSTGGNPSLYLTSKTISVLVQRSLEGIQRGLESIRAPPVFKRNADTIIGNSNVMILRGIKRLAYTSNIENTSVVCTGFTFFVLCGYFLAGFIIASKYAIDLCIKAGWIRNTRFWAFRHNWRVILKGSLLRYIYIGFTQLTLLSFWEFTQNDSPALIVIAVLFLIQSLGLMLWAAYRTISFARLSVEQRKNPAAILYGDQRVLDKYGFFYTMFSAKRYWWNCVILVYILLKSIFISFCQASGKTQALAIFIIDLAYFVVLIKFQPYFDRPTNIVNILITTVTLVNSFLFLFFSDLFGQPGRVSSIMGWVFFIMNAAFSLILLILILIFVCMVIFSKNPDLRFKPAKDDRTSFQRVSDSHGKINKSVAAELMALGNTAKNHDENWEEELYNQQKLQKEQSVSGLDYSDEKLTGSRSNSDDQEDATRLTLAEKLKRKLSFKRTKSTKSTSSRARKLANTDDAPVTSLSREPSTSSAPVVKRDYPGVHSRQQSESKNGLIGSNAVENSKLETLAQEDDAPLVDTDNYQAPHSGSVEFGRDESMDSVNVAATANATSSTDLFTNDGSYYNRL